MTGDDLRKAERILDLRDAEEDPANFAVLNWRFHTALYEPARQPRLMAMIRSLHASFDLYAGRYAAAWMSLKAPAQRQHRLIVEACRHGGEEAAIAVLERNIRDGFLERPRHMHEQGPGDANERRDGEDG